MRGALPVHTSVRDHLGHWSGIFHRELLDRSRSHGPLKACNRSGNPQRAAFHRAAHPDIDSLTIPRLRPVSPGSQLVSLKHISHILPTVYKPPRVAGMASTSQGTIFFATGNKNKIKEVVAILESQSEDPLPFSIQAADLDLPELQGEPEDIAKEKCRLAAQQVGGSVIVEDTCLCFEAYKGLPGPYVKWFLAKIGLEGLNNMLAAYDNKRAYAQCIFAFTPGPEADPKVFLGVTPGTIVPARGDAVFGWDPIFEPEGFNQTFAEMDKKVKNTISHRFRALDKLIRHLRTISAVPGREPIR